MALIRIGCTETCLDNSELSCPFTWDIEKCLKNMKILECRDPTIYDLPDIPFLSFITHLVCSIECLLVKKNLNEATKMLATCEMLLKNIRADYDDIIRSLEHIFYATKYYILLRIEGPDANTVKYIRNKIVPVSNLNNFEHGPLFGLKGYTLALYMKYDINGAIECAKRAIQCNPRYAVWYFVLAYALRKERRTNTYYQSASDLEYNNFKSAYELSKCTYYRIYYVQSLYERWSFSHGMDWYTNREQILNLLKIYRDILSSGQQNLIVMLKIVLGLLRISRQAYRFQDYDAAKPHIILAHQILDKVDIIYPENSTAYHYRGCLWQLVRLDEKASECYRRAADLGNTIAIFSYALILMYTIHKDRGMMIEHLLGYLESVEGTLHEQKMLLYIGIGYFATYDIKTAVEYILKAIQLDPENKNLINNFQMSWFRQKSIYDFVANTLLPLLKKRIIDENLKENLENLKKCYNSHIEQLKYTKLFKLLADTEKRCIKFK